MGREHKGWRLDRSFKIDKTCYKRKQKKERRRSFLRAEERNSVTPKDPLPEY